MSALPRPLCHLPQAARPLAEETAIALSCRGATQAVLMATPAALEDFALGFCLTEGVIARPAELEDVEVVPRPLGVELRLALAPAAEAALAGRRRRLAGALGCGLCGVESLEAALRRLPPLPPGPRLRHAEVAEAVAALGRTQVLHQEAHALHAAGFWRPGRGLLLAREDVGRHNALDKLAGALARAGEDPAAGAVVLTSRVSVELVQKAATAGIPILVAIAAPTALAVRTAEACGLTLVAGARGGRGVAYAGGGRLT